VAGHRSRVTGLGSRSGTPHSGLVRAALFLRPVTCHLRPVTSPDYLGDVLCSGRPALDFTHVLETRPQPDRLRPVRAARIALRVRQVLHLLPVATRRPPLHRRSDVLRSLPHRLRIQDRGLTLLVGLRLALHSFGGVGPRWEPGDGLRITRRAKWRCYVNNDAEKLLRALGVITSNYR
jgi:hypothetical protein